jgi:O-antigen/teichoic acid export membrane protein
MTDATVEIVDVFVPADDTARPGLLAGVGKDAFWSYVAVAATTVSTAAIPALVVRRVGPAADGLYALVTAASLLVAPIDAALSLTVSRAAAREAAGDRRERQRLNASHAMYGTLAWAVLAIAGVGAAAALLGLLPLNGESPRQVAMLIMCVGASVALTAATATFNGVLLGNRRFRTVSAAAILGATVTCGLLVVLLDRIGVVGLGIAVVAGTAANRGLVVRSSRRLAPWLTGVARAARSGADYITERKHVLTFALPLVIVGVGGQIVATTDVFVLGLFASAATIGVFRAGSLLPTQAIGLVYRGYDAAFPALAASDNRADQERAVTFLARIASFGSGLVFGALALLAHPVIRILLGFDSDMGATVLRIFAAVWVVNATVHGLALLLIARGRQRVFTPLVAAEAAANLLLTFVLVARWGAVGAAWATLVTIGASNLFALPYLTRHEVRRPFVLVFRDGLAFALLGLGVAAAAISLAGVVR